MDNVKLVGGGRADIAFALADTAADGYNGAGKFKEKEPIRSIAVLYANKSQWVTVEGTGIENDAGPEGQAHRHRRAGQRHRGHRPRASSRRMASTRRRT